MQNTVRQKQSQFKLSTRNHVLLLILIATLPVLGLILYNGYQDRHDARKLGRNQAMDVLRAIQFKQQNVIESTNQLLTALDQSPMTQSHPPAPLTPQPAPLLSFVFDRRPFFFFFFFFLFFFFFFFFF